MVADPAYIIGLGTFGTNVVTAVRDRSREFATGAERQFGFMSVAADHSVLENKTDVTTVALTSDSGIVGDTISSYPYLTEDITVPADRSVRRRHVGRYKLDNPVAPAFQDYFKMLHRHLEQFIEQQATGTRTSRPGTCTVVLVSSLADGTGSGALPLVTAAVTNIAENLDTEIRLVGVGAVPPLDTDLTGSYPPVDPVSYPNTYGSFRNLISLTETDDGESLDVPFYSWGNPHEDLTQEAVLETAGDAQKVLRVSKPAFDTYWLVSRQSVGSDKRHAHEFATTVGNALYATLRHTSHVDGSQATPNDSPLGTLGYSALGVPHTSVRQFCEYKKERAKTRSQLEEFVEPRIEALRERQQEIEKTLHMQVNNSPLVPKLIERVYDCLEENPDDDYEFVDSTTPDELTAALDALADQSDICSYFLTISALEWSLSGGRISSSVRANVSQTIKTVQDEHDLTLFTGTGPGTPSTLEGIETVESELEELREQYQERVLRVDEPIRDLLPPVNELFSSTREQRKQDLERLDKSLTRMESCRAIIEQVDELHSVCTQRKREAHERIRHELQTTQEEISHYQSTAEKLAEQIEHLTEELATLRHSLTTRDSDGLVTTLPLDRAALRNLTVEDAEALSSLKDYREHGLLDDDPEELTRRIIDLCAESRAWPEEISRHDTPVAIHGYDGTALLYNRTNEPVIDTGRLSAAVPNFSQPSSEGEHTDDPYLIEVVSASQAGRFSSLRGFRQLVELENRGLLRALAGPYQDYRRALAYPEWYDGEDIGFE